MLKLVTYLWLLTSTVFAGCIINIDKVTGKHFPLLIQNNNFLYPSNKNADGENILKFDDEEEVDLFCHGSSKYQQIIYVKLNEDHDHEKKQKVPLYCKGDQFFLSNTMVTRSHLPITVEEISCSQKQEPVLRRYKEKCSPMGADGRTDNLQDLVRVSIGWQIEWNFVEQIQLCHDEKLYETIWTNHTVHGANIEYKDSKKGPRPGFKADNDGFTSSSLSSKQRFYKWTTKTKLNKIYSKKSQVKMIKAILGTNNKLDGKIRIIESGNRGTNYFAKGHLSPDAAFITTVEQDATYYFMNVAPQFQSFNNGNWVALESNLREYAAKVGRDILVFTGTHGVLQYPNYNNEMKDIFLYSKQEDGYYIPAPKYYWKVLYDPEQKASVAFIGLNDPHAKQTPKLLCQNRCSLMSWVDWMGKSTEEELDEGYMYCCTVKEARKAIPSMPELPAGGLLGEDTENTGDTCKAGGCYCTCRGNTKDTCTCTCPGDL